MPLTQTPFQESSHTAKRAQSTCKITNWDSNEIKQRGAKKKSLHRIYKQTVHRHRNTQANTIVSMKGEVVFFLNTLLDFCEYKLDTFSDHTSSIFIWLVNGRILKRKSQILLSLMRLLNVVPWVMFFWCFLWYVILLLKGQIKVQVVSFEGPCGNWNINKTVNQIVTVFIQ